MAQQDIISSVKLGYINTVSKLHRRIDGRAFDQYREISIKTGVAERAEGSALVKLGDTMVLVGVKIEQATPYPDMPNMGTMSTGTELVPFASPTFEPGPPSPQSIEIARVVDRAIRESKLIDMEKLCITPGEKIWGVSIDVHVLDYDGNIIDAATTAAVAALMTAKVPNSKHGLGDDAKLPLKSVVPVTCTSAKIGNILLSDPDLDEDRAADAKLSVCLDERGHVHAMQKALEGSFTVDEIKNIIKTAEINGALIREQILKSVV